MSAQNLYTIRRAIALNGKPYAIQREQLDDYGDTTDAMDTLFSGRGLYHESSGFLDVSLSDSGHVETRKTPMLLILYGDAPEGKMPEIDDRAEIDGKPYRITGVRNPGGLDLVLDLSLREA